MSLRERATVAPNRPALPGALFLWRVGQALRGAFWTCSLPVTREAHFEPHHPAPGLSELFFPPLSSPFSKQTYFLIKLILKPDLCN